MVKIFGAKESFYSCTEPHRLGTGICGALYSTRIGAENCFCQGFSEPRTYSSEFSKEISKPRIPSNNYANVANEVRGLMHENIEIGDDFYDNLIEEISSIAKLGQRCMLVRFLGSFSAGGRIVCSVHSRGGLNRQPFQFLKGENWPGGWTSAGVEMVKEELQGMGFRVRDTLESKDVNQQQKPAIRKVQHGGRIVDVPDFDCIDKNGAIGTFSIYPSHGNKTEWNQLIWNLAIYW
jgi:hypothetical protein